MRWCGPPANVSSWPVPETDADLERLLLGIAARIRSRRQEVSLSQEHAAGVAGIDYKRWQRIEAGDVNCTVRTLHRIARALECEVADLVGPPPVRGVDTVG